ncbi:MAG: EamA family transporter [Aggregatilineales bacterium]
MTSILLGLLAAVFYGTSDFSGGLATKRANVFGVVVVSQCFGLLTVAVVALSNGDPLPPPVDLVWGALAGLAGVAGLIAFYRALSIGQMGIATPITAVFAAGLPVAVAAITQGLPGVVPLLGFGLGLLGVWLLARTERHTERDGLRPELSLAILAGLCLGAFLIAIHHASAASAYWPLLAARVASISLVSLVAARTQRNWLPSRAALPLVIAAGVLDMTGNIFFVLAGQMGRLDVASVLAALYPAVTVLLATVLLREPVTRSRLIGIGTALVAVLLIVRS